MYIMYYIIIKHVWLLLSQIPKSWFSILEYLLFQGNF